MPEKTEITDPADTYRVATSGDIEVSTYLEIAKEIKGEQSLDSDSVSPTKQETIVIIDYGSPSTRVSYFRAERVL